jgi:hypothetical protein
MSRTRPALRAEVLEDRSTPATLTVVDGYGGSGTSGDLAYCLAYANAHPDPDIIVFSPTVRGILTGPQGNLDGVPFVYQITTPVTIVGSGSGQEIRPILPLSPADRQFLVLPGGDLTLRNLTVFGGVLSQVGGAIYNRGTLTVDHCTLTQNMSRNGPTPPDPGPGRGGAIYNTGTLTVKDSTIAENITPGLDPGQGGGIYNAGGTVTLTNVTFAANTAKEGSAVYNTTGTDPITGADTPGTVIATNCIFAADAGVTSVIANVRPAGSTADATIRAAGPNIITAAIVNDGGTVTGVPFTVADPLLSALGDFGGPTQTVTPLAGSPAIDAGDTAAATAAGLTTDQREFVRVFGSAVDLGAVEVGAPEVPPAEVLPPAVVCSGGSDNAALLYTVDGTGTLQPLSTPIDPFGDLGGLTGTVRSATADVNGDGVADVILVTGPGLPTRLAVVSGRDNKTVIAGPADPLGNQAFFGGAFVAAADLNGDGRAEVIVTPDMGGGPNVVVFSFNADGTLAGDPRAFFALGNPGFRGGARVAVGDINHDGVPDVAVGAGFLGGPNVEIHDGKALAAGNFATLVGSGFFAFDGSDATTLRNGVFLSVGDVNGDGFADLIAGGGPGGGPRVLVLDGKMLAAGNVTEADASPVANFFVGDDANRGGVRVAAANIDGDNKADLVVGSGEGLPSQVRVYLGKDCTGSGEPSAAQNLDPFGQTLPGGVFVG